MHACPRLFCASALPPRFLLCLCVALLSASACQQPSAAQTPSPDPSKAASPDTSGAPTPATTPPPATSAPATSAPATSAPATSAPATSAPAPTPIPTPSTDAARPSAPSPGTDAQRTLLTQADQAIRDGDIDTAALTLLTLLQSPEHSEERLAGILLITEIYRAESHNMPKGQDPTKKLNRALKILTDNEAKFPPTVEYYESFADVYEELKRPQDAASALQKAVTIDPGRLNLLARLTYFALTNGQPPIAAESLKQYEASRAQILPVLTSPQTPPSTSSPSSPPSTTSKTPYSPPRSSPSSSTPTSASSEPPSKPSLPSTPPTPPTACASPPPTSPTPRSSKCSTKSPICSPRTPARHPPASFACPPKHSQHPRRRQRPRQPQTPDAGTTPPNTHFARGTLDGNWSY